MRARVLARASPSATIAVVGEPDSELALVVDEEHPVGVAVEGEADVGAGRRAPGPGGRAGSRAGSGRPGGSGTCRRARRTASSSSNGRPVEDRRARRGRPCRWRCRPRPCSGRSAVDVDERADVVGERGEQVVAARAGPALGAPAGSPLGAVALISAQAGVLADRAGAGEAELDAVVRGRVVRGGEHRAGGVEVRRRRSRAGRWSASPRSTTSTPWPVHALGEGGGELGARRAHVAGDEDPGGARRLSATKRAKAAPTRAHDGRRRAGRGRCRGCRRP